MRRLVTALASLAVVSMLVPSIGLAIEAPVENGVGILCVFTGEDLATADNVLAVTPGVPFNLYFIIYNEQISSDNLGGVEFAWRLEPAVPAPFVLSNEFPAGTLSLGDNFNVILGFGAGVPTIDNHARVMKPQLMYTTAPGEVRLFLSSPIPDSIDGEMAYNDFNNPGDIRVLKPNSVGGLYTEPVFGFNMTVATETATWGSVKSLFR